MTEFAVILPILALLLLAIGDFARLYSTMITVEAGAREAADSGTLYPWQWDPANRPNTVAEMERRACVATKALPEYDDPDDDAATGCANPSFAYTLDSTPAGVTEDNCPNVPRLSTPCNVRVDLTFTFDLIAPGGLLGLPSSFTFTRSSTFALSDFEVDQP